MASNAVQLALGALAAAAVGVGAVWLIPSTDTSTSDEVAAVAEVIEDISPEQVVEQPEPAVVEVVAPTVGLRIDQDGFATIVGTWNADADIDILIDGAQLDRVQTDRAGNYAYVTQIEPSEKARILSIVADPDGDAVVSVENPLIRPSEVAVAAVEPLEELAIGAVTNDVAEAVVEEELAEPEPTIDVEEVAVAVEVATTEEEATTVEEVTTEDEVTTEVAVAEDNQMAGTEEQSEIVEEIVVTIEPSAEIVIEEPVAQTPEIKVEEPEIEAGETTLIADSGGVRVVPLDDSAPQVLANVALDSITYDPEGEVLLTGRAGGEGFVQVYVDNQPVTTSRISASGDWRTDLPEVDTGVYTLRIDEVDAEGTVVSRIETPFKREEAEAVAEVMAEETAAEDFQVAVRTVQPGATLWAIAREQFGEGVMYVAVYEANKDLIRDPNLIYPGQVFRIPKIDE